MQLLKVVVMGTVATLSTGLLTNVSDLKPSPADYAGMLQENENESPDPGKNPYEDSSLTNASENEVLADSGDPQGTDTFENRAEKVSARTRIKAYSHPKVAVNTSNRKADNYLAETTGNDKSNGVVSGSDNITAGSSNTDTAHRDENLTVAGTGTISPAAENTAASNPSDSVPHPAENNVPAAADNGQASIANNSVADNTPAASGTAGSSPSDAVKDPATAENTGNNETASVPADTSGNAAAENTDNTPSYNHTTSIYTNDESTLLRVEYYDDDNRLFEYSSVTNYDKETNSYTETVYQYDKENQAEIVVRTDTYVNGELVSSERP